MFFTYLRRELPSPSATGHTDPEDDLEDTVHPGFGDAEPADTVTFD